MAAIVKAGLGIINPLIECPGTIGVISSRGPEWYILSCYHVLFRLHREPFIPGENIFLSDLSPDGLPIAAVAEISSNFDAAIARINDDVEVETGVGDIPQFNPPMHPEEGMEVIKFGSATGRTFGVVNRVEENDVWIYPPEGHVGEISEGGDSGAVWISTQTLSPVALHTGRNDATGICIARGVILGSVLESLNLEI